MSILQLDTAPALYPIGSTFQLRRNAWSRELITATVETVRMSSCGWVYTIAINDRYPHWRIMFQGQIERQIVIPAAIAA